MRGSPRLLSSLPSDCSAPGRGGRGGVRGLRRGRGGHAPKDRWPPISCQTVSSAQHESDLVDCALASQTFRGFKVLKDNQVQPTHFRAEATEDIPKAAEGQCPARTSRLLREPHFFINEAP